MPLVALLSIFGAGFMLAPALAGSSGQATTKDGIYTGEQANLGKTLYGQQCAECHGDKLEGKGQNPPLAGADFMSQWQDQTLDDLYTVIKGTMPANKPGSLTPEQSVQLIAYLLQVNNMPAGKTELPKDEAYLKTVHIEKP